MWAEKAAHARSKHDTALNDDVVRSRRCRLQSGPDTGTPRWAGRDPIRTFGAPRRPEADLDAQEAVAPAPKPRRDGTMIKAAAALNLSIVSDWILYGVI